MQLFCGASTEIIYEITVLTFFYPFRITVSFYNNVWYHNNTLATIM